ncbi:MAG: SurA N-terminal domain-containing protein [Elusimicrobia bacterium]|nr:SurA N-terminal domain-containing protein [Elusimicrobiota bacterium]
MRFIRKHKEPLLLLTLGFFFLSFFVGLSSVLVNNDERNLAAKVGKSKIPNQSFAVNYRQALEGTRSQNPNLELTNEFEQALRENVLRDLIIRELFTAEAKTWGLEVTPRLVVEDIARRPVFQKEGRFDPNLYVQFVMRTLGVTPGEFEKEHQKDLEDRQLRNLISWTFPAIPTETQWLYRIEKPTATVREFEQEAASFGQQMEQQRVISMVNFYLNQLTQKYPIRTFLQQSAPQ